MQVHRRLVLRGLLGFAAIMALPRQLLAAGRPDDAFKSEDIDAAMTGLLGQKPMESDQITLKVPDIAENGAVVPVTISTTLTDVESMSIFVDNNPTPLAASFAIGPRTTPKVAVRIKMGDTSQVRAVVKAGGKVYSTAKEVKVTIGGCGG